MVSEELRKRIDDAVIKLNYIPNHLAGVADIIPALIEFAMTTHDQLVGTYRCARCPCWRG